MSQLIYFLNDYKRAIGKHWYRGLYIWTSPSIIGIFCYRLERGMFLTIKNPYKILRIFFYPIIHLINIISRVDIPYHTNIGPGLLIYHSALGVIINGNCVIGKNFTLVGGNCIGLKKTGKIIIGDDCFIGANSTIIGPLRIGNNVTINASSCVIKNLPDYSVYSGVPELLNNNWILK